jgi:hypothetical protein
MVIWSGRGWVGFLPLFVLGVPMQLFAEDVLHVRYVGWPLSVVFALTGVIAFVAGTAWNGGRQTQPRNPHTLFFVPLQFWGPILWAAALVNVVIALV